MDNKQKKELQILAAKIRLGIIEGTYHAKAGHPGGSLSAADVLAYLYGKEMNVDSKILKWRTETALFFQKVTLHLRFTVRLHIQAFSLPKI